MGVFKRGSKWYVEHGGRQLSTKLDATEENRAQALEVYAGLKRQTTTTGAGGGKVARIRQRTVADYVEEWLSKQTYRTLADDATRLRKHALPLIGRVALRDIHARDIRSMMDALKAKAESKELANRTVLHIYRTTKRMFQRAVDDELLDKNPCNLRRGELPSKTDKDPTWRAGARFTREEVERLMSDERIPEDRRVVYSIIFLTGARIGEVIALRWSDIEARQPLDALHLSRSWNTKERTETSTKTETAKEAPIHPALRAVLDRWRAAGWAKRYGRAPESDDLIAPQPLDRAKGRRIGGPRVPWSADTFRKRCYLDLKKLGLRERSPHDGRSTFISLTTEDGCNADIVHRITHPSPEANARDGYNRPAWASLCAEILKLQIAVPETSAPDPAPPGGGGQGRSSRRVGRAAKAPPRPSTPSTPRGADSGTDSLEVIGIIGRKMEPAGIEPASESRSQ